VFPIFKIILNSLFVSGITDSRDCLIKAMLLNFSWFLMSSRVTGTDNGLYGLRFTTTQFELSEVGSG